MRFQNSSNFYVEQVSLPFLWTLLFGPLYFAVKGVWTHAIVSAIVGICTFGLSWLIYPFFASKIMRTHYLRKGWIEIGENEEWRPLWLPIGVVVAAILAAVTLNKTITIYGQPIIKR